jgi:hypothetical protein
MSYKQKRVEEAPATTAKSQGKVLLADTIGRSLYLRQIQLDIYNSCSEPLLISEPGRLFGSKSPASQWLLVPSQHLPGSATTSSETLTTETRDATLCNNSPAPSKSDRHTSTESIASRARIVSLKGTATEQDAEWLALEYGLPSQMGLLDPSYSIFINEQKSGGVCFKILTRWPSY